MAVSTKSETASGKTTRQLQEIGNELADLHFHTSKCQAQFEQINANLKALRSVIERESNEDFVTSVAYPQVRNLRNAFKRIIAQYEASEGLPIIAELVTYTIQTYGDLKSSRTEQPANQSSDEYKHRQRAYEVVGPLLTPGQVAERLGVSLVTVNNWRKQNKLLGLRFDSHQYQYPAWQFADSPEEGEHGVLRNLDMLLKNMKNEHPWVIARFCLRELPQLGDKTVLHVLRTGDAQALEVVKELAQHPKE
jgi:hypothetical protein